ncbi:hypothetical protein ACFYXC_27010 [Streptomyces sp. NPDC002701]|uniref:hypothetical protein n=1 Tax=unclassified Streptomyces TaxID=2593676 RepID=UPI0036C6D906
MRQGVQEPQWTRVSPEPQESHGPQQNGSQQTLDPPIYRAMVRAWADRGRTLPGRHDPEWTRLVAPAVMYGYGRFSVTRDQRGDGR